MIQKGERGSISIFLAISLLAIVMLLGVFIDAARASCARNDAARAADTAAVSVLASYDKALRRDYGIFAISSGSLGDGSADEYVLRNLVVDEGEECAANSTQLYRYAVEGTRVAPALPLLSIDVADRQIIEFMKFRAPLSLASEAVQKLRAASEAPRIAEPLQKKMDIDKRLESVGKEQVELIKRVAGVSVVYELSGAKKAKEYEKTVNGYLTDSFKTDAAPLIAGSYAQCVEINAYIRQSEKEAKERGDPKPDLSADKSDMAEVKRVLIKEIDDVISTMDLYIRANEKALECVGNLSDKAVQIKPMIDELDKLTGGLVDLESAKGMAKELDQEAKKAREWLMTKEEAAALSGPLIANVAALRAERAALEKLFGKLRSVSPTEPPVSESEIVSTLEAKTRGYDDKIAFQIDAAYAELAAPDPRQTALDAAGTFMNDTGLKNSDPSTELGIRMAELPSRHMTRGSGAADEVAPGEPAVDAPGEPAEGEPGEPAEDGLAKRYADNPGKALRNEMNLLDTQSGFAADKLGALAALGDLALFLGENGRDRLYRAEYALSVFNNAVGEPYMWATDSLVKRDGFYKAEIEYLLHGQTKQSTNVFITKAQIFGLRVGLNLAHVYSDPEKVQLSQGAAAAIVGAWCAPLIPVAQGLIMTAWSAMEAYRDVGDLYSGSTVPLIKTKADWKTDIGLKSAAGDAIKGAGGGTPAAAAGGAAVAKAPLASKLVQFSYLDYLRMYLVLMNREKFVGRVLDLIEINAKKEGVVFKAKDMYCGARVEMDLSVNHLFIASALAPGGDRTAPGRYRISVAAERDLF